MENTKKANELLKKAIKETEKTNIFLSDAFKDLDIIIICEIVKYWYTNKVDDIFQNEDGQDLEEWIENELELIKEEKNENPNKKIIATNNMENTFLDRLKTEKNELLDKTTKLGMFLTSEKVKELSDANTLLLKQQFEIMNAYLNILIIRIELNE